MSFHITALTRINMCLIENNPDLCDIIMLFKMLYLSFFFLLCRRHTLYGGKIVYITYDDRPKLLYYTINLGGQNTVDNGRKSVENRRK